MKCEDFIRLIDAYIDGELDNAEEEKLLTHARECENCARELENARMLRDMLSGMDDDIVPPLAAQAGWRSAVKAEARKKRMKRIYKYCGTVAAALVIMVGIFAGLDMFDAENAPQGSGTVTQADAGFVFVATDGGEATSAPAAMARTVSAPDDEVAGSSASVKLISEEPASACELIGSLAAEFGGYTDAQGGSSTGAYLTAYIPAECIDQFVDSLSLAGEVSGYQLNDSGSAEVAVTITIKPAE